jgi:hypothetical protein
MGVQFTVFNAGQFSSSIGWDSVWVNKSYQDSYVGTELQFLKLGGFQVEVERLDARALASQYMESWAATINVSLLCSLLIRHLTV